MNYSEIVDLALSYEDRTDAEVSSRIPNFLRIVESRVNRSLKTMGMCVRTRTATVEGQEYYALPEDYEGMRDIEIKDALVSTSRTTLQYATPDYINNLGNISGLGGVYYTIVANQIQIAPVQAGGKILEIIYYRKLIPIDTTFPENWLSISNPDAYIFGLMVEISAFLKDLPAKQLWDERFKEALNDIQINDTSQRWAGTSMKVVLG